MRREKNGRVIPARVDPFLVKRRQTYKSRRPKWIALLPIGALVVLAVWLTLPSNAPVQNMPQTDAHLRVTMAGWSPNQISAKVGVPLRIMIMTDASERTMGDNVHSFILNATGTHETVKAGNTDVFTVTFQHAGAYTFWCLTCCGVTTPSLADAYMSGTVTVT